MNRRMMLSALLAIGAGLGLGGAASAATLRSQEGPYELEVLSYGGPARTFSHAGESYVLGQNGERYTLRVWNRSNRRVEVVASVDGRDVVDGKAADYSKRGYVVPAYGHVDIDGWRLSSGQVAAFRFSSVARSYAARTGSAREVGVIGVAVFPERLPPRPLYVPTPRPYPPRPDYYGDGYGSGYGRGRAEADEAPASRSAPPAAAPPPADKAKAAEPSQSAPRGGAMVERERRESRPGLGTSFGEAVDSAVYETEFVRAGGRPSSVLGVRYNDREGLLAMGVDVDGCRYYAEPYLRRSAEPFPVSDRRYAAPPPAWEY